MSDSIPALIDELRRVAGLWSVPPQVDGHPRHLMEKAAAALESLSAPTPSDRQVGLGVGAPASDDEREAQIAAWREHSVTLNRMTFDLATAMGLNPDGLDAIVLDPSEVLAEALRRLSPLTREALIETLFSTMYTELAWPDAFASTRETFERMADAVLSSLSVPEPAGTFTLAQVATEIRLHCTLDWEVTKKGGDALISAVADWVENPPEWVTALRVVPVEVTDGMRRTVAKILVSNGVKPHDPAYYRLIDALTAALGGGDQ